MAAGNFEMCLKFTLQFEGGFVNDPDDPGGPTNLGVTQATLSTFLGRQATIAEVQALTPEKVAPIYHLRFWDSVHGDQLPVGMDLAVFDFGVHSGPSRGVISLQRVLELGDDGKIGPVTIAAANKADPKTTVNGVCDERMAFLRSLKVFKKFGKGLTSRVDKCRKAALSMI
ncbi:MAG TPA: glycosyl hydrolase 108 family protein [Roseiarcus sp.]|jgi:lysozyme family protein